MDAPTPPPHLAVAAVVLYTAVSSVLGLGGRFLIDQDGVGAFIIGVWMDGFPLADAVFVLGSATTAVVAFHVARQGLRGWSVAVAAVMSMVTYVTSFLALPMNLGRSVPLADAVMFVTGWGAPGLGFAAVAPALAATWWARRRRVTAPTASAGPGAP